MPIAPAASVTIRQSWRPISARAHRRKLSGRPRTPAGMWRCTNPTGSRVSTPPRRVEPAMAVLLIQPEAVTEPGFQMSFAATAALVALAEVWPQPIREIDVPTAVLVTTDDKAVPATEQARLIVGIPTATIHRVDDGHVVCARPLFGRAITDAVVDVADRVAARHA